MSVESLAALRSARLARLRAIQPRAGGGPADPAPGSTVQDAGSGIAVLDGPRERARRGPHQRANTLAGQLGGRVVDGPVGPVVVVERRHRVALDRDLLRELPEPLDPEQPVVCLDTETTGLGTAAGTLPFLVGIGAWQADELVVRQLVLADHPDEPALLACLAEFLLPGSQLVTYNGRTFDWPLLVTRFRLMRHGLPALGGHLDLLPLARRVWKHRLPDARLASVEAAVCGVARHDDLPGADIPARYLTYLRTGHAGMLLDVLRHNEQDVVSLAELLRVLTEALLPAGPRWRPGVAAKPRSDPDDGVDPGDLGGLGSAYGRRGRHDAALACYEAALERLDGPRRPGTFERIAIDRARTLTRLGQRREAESAWHAIALEGGSAAALAWCQVAKHREHDAQDLPAALTAARKAQAVSERARLFGHPDRLVERDLARRIPRLLRRLRTADGAGRVALPTRAGGQEAAPWW